MKKLILFLIVLNCFSLFSKEKDSLKKSNFIVLPLVYYQPETSLAFETFAIYNFKFKNARHSHIRLFNAYTLNKQFMSIMPWQIFSNNEKFLFSGRVEYKYFPELFYGIGNQTCETYNEKYTFKTFNFNPKLLKKTNENVFMGGDLQFIYNKNEINENSEFFKSKINLIGKNKYHLFSLGFNIIKDTRDNVMNPKKGQYF